MSHSVSGLAALIRSSTESETFDLAGYTCATIETHIRDAFSQPFTTLTDDNSMIRLTFITGAGKLGRQKYEDGAARAVTSTLQNLGFVEDRGASAIRSCAGTYKLQHDTGKNLKTVVVFPRVTTTGATTTTTTTGAGGGPEELSSGTTSDDHRNDLTTALHLTPDSPEHKLVYAPWDGSNNTAVFEKMIQSKCPSWSQKKSCVAVLEECKTVVEALETKLMAGTAPLTRPEQDLYDTVSLSSLQEKLTYCRNAMHDHVDRGAITAPERMFLLEQVKERLQKLELEIAEARQQNKPKRVEQLLAQARKAAERHTKLQTMTPQPPAPLRTEAALTKLRLELAPLQEMEQQTKGRLLTLKESQAAARKEEILLEMAQQEEASRGWFESDEAFHARLEQSRSAGNARTKSTKKKTTTTNKTTSAPPSAKWSATAATSSSNKWSTPAPPKPVATKAKASKTAGSDNNRGLFAAMMADDSDDDE